jgi:hypothetical protein
VDESVAVIDENGAPILLGEPVSYNQVMTAALGYFDAAIALASSAPGGLSIPSDWVGTPAAISMPEMVQIMNSFKARYRASVARNPTERAAVNWNAVLAETGAGITSNFNQDAGVVYTTWIGGSLGFLYAWSSTWQQVTYFMFGMADQAGDYQAWLNIPVADRDAFFPGTTTPVLIRTPDLRFPQGNTIQEQVNNYGTYVGIRRSGTPPNATVNNAVQYSRPDRGTWRWSQYYSRPWDPTGGWSPDILEQL